MHFVRAVSTFVCVWAATALHSTLANLENLSLKDVPQAVVNSGVLNDAVVFGYTYESMLDSSKIPWSSLTHLVLAFFQVSSSGNVTVANNNLQYIVGSAHKNGVKVIASIGGSDVGSAGLASALGDEAASARLTLSVIDNIRQHNLDGIDYDYEFPENTNQVQGLYLALRSARAALDSTFGKGKKVLTTTLFSSKGQFGPNVPKVDSKPFSDIVDYGLLMSYDYFGSFSEISAPNSPFYDVPGYPGLSFTSSISAWLDAGWDPKKLVAGLAYYGRTAIVGVGSAGKSQFMVNSGAAPPSGPVNKIAGAWTWSDLRDPQNGALIAPSEANQGWQRFWDKTTETPWLLHNVSQTYIGYDDMDSLTIKANHIITNGLVGAMVWMVQYDFDLELNSVIQNYSAACSRIAQQALADSEAPLLESVSLADDKDSDSNSASENGERATELSITPYIVHTGGSSGSLYHLAMLMMFAALTFSMF
ncbi:hypothetical protein GGF37_004152 [Kickxella alabastrina]|nr:hypothetical protein GGF37_004152 [Kickxella alabastrina]